MAGEFDPYAEWLKVTASERPPGHYELLGLPRFKATPGEIEKAAQERMALVRAYQIGPRKPIALRLIRELTAAESCLTRPAARRAYDEQLARQMGLSRVPNQAVVEPRKNQTVELIPEQSAQPTTRELKSPPPLPKQKTPTVARDAQASPNKRPPAKTQIRRANYRVTWPVAFVICFIVTLTFALRRAPSNLEVAALDSPAVLPPLPSEPPSPAYERSEETPADPDEPDLSLPGANAFELATVAAPESLVIPVSASSPILPPQNVPVPQATGPKPAGPSVATPTLRRFAYLFDDANDPQLPSREEVEPVLFRLKSEVALAMNGSNGDDCVAARKLIPIAKGMRDPLEQTVLLMQAQHLALNASDSKLPAIEQLDLILEIADLLDNRYPGAVYDSIAFSLNLLTVKGSFGSQADAAQERVFACATRVLDRDQTDDAESLIEAAAEWSKSAVMKRRRLDLDSVIEERDQLRELAKQVIASDEAPTAHDYETAGQYICLARGDWQAGLEVLAQAEKPGLRELAMLEQRVVAEMKTTSQVGDASRRAPKLLELADGWWELARRATDFTQKPLALHAKHWYEEYARGPSTGRIVEARARANSLAAVSLGSSWNPAILDPSLAKQPLPGASRATPARPDAGKTAGKANNKTPGRRPGTGATKRRKISKPYSMLGGKGRGTTNVRKAQETTRQIAKKNRPAPPPSVDDRQLTARIKQAIKDETYELSERLGVESGLPFKDVSKFQMLAGFDYTANETGWQSIRPIYWSSRSTGAGTQIGQPEGKPIRVLAQRGYAVGAIAFSNGYSLSDCVVIFMKITPRGLDANSSYVENVGIASDPTKSSQDTARNYVLGGEGKPIVGLVGTISGIRSQLIQSLGLIVLPSE